MHSGFYTPARIIAVFCSRQYEYQNNDLNARYNLWQYLMWERIFNGDS